MEKVLREIWKQLGLRGVIRTERDEAIVEKIMGAYGISSPFLSKETTKIKCSRCGKIVRSYYSFCWHCGNPLPTTTIKDEDQK